ncbi:phage protein Gp37 [Pseudomonas sp. GZD-209]|uniref:phage protein Gp37 n=1 Tax=Pseudomonas sp. GZD-209 TaxID=3404807 RepID=UPI003BB6408A
MLAKVEDAMIERCRELVGDRLKAIEDLPGNWDEATLAAARRNVPGIYIAWSGGSAVTSGRPMINGRYAVYVVTGHASGERARRRGNGRDIGAYEILERVVPGLHGLSVDGVGTLRLERVDNLYSDQGDKKGVIVYGAVFTIDKMPFPAAKDASSLADFEIFHTTSKVPDGPDTEGHHVFPNGNEATP